MITERCVLISIANLIVWEFLNFHVLFIIYIPNGVAQYGLKLQVYLLVDRASKLGPIEQMSRDTLNGISSTNMKLTILLSFVVVIAVLLALAFSFFLSRSLHRLALGMDSLAMLRFDAGGSYLVMDPSHFSEVNDCEGSFLALERFMFNLQVLLDLLNGFRMHLCTMTFKIVRHEYQCRYN